MENEGSGHPAEAKRSSARGCQGVRSGDVLAPPRACRADPRLIESRSLNPFCKDKFVARVPPGCGIMGFSPCWCPTGSRTICGVSRLERERGSGNVPEPEANPAPRDQKLTLRSRRN